MNYAVLSLPFMEDTVPDGSYDTSSPRNLIGRADKYAKGQGLVRGVDYEIFSAGTIQHLTRALDKIRNYHVIYLDIHGPAGKCAQLPSTIAVPGTTNDERDCLDVSPTALGLRESSVELLIVGSCHQTQESWEHAVPPGCVVIGYKELLKPKHHRHMFERFIDLQQLLKEGRTTGPDALPQWQNDIVEWFDKVLNRGTHRPKPCDWFITAGATSSV